MISVENPINYLKTLKYCVPSPMAELPLFLPSYRRRKRSTKIADLISKLRAKIMAVVRGATFLINARCKSSLNGMAEKDEREWVGVASGFMHHFV